MSNSNLGYTEKVRESTGYTWPQAVFCLSLPGTLQTKMIYLERNSHHGFHWLHEEAPGSTFDKPQFVKEDPKRVWLQHRDNYNDWEWTHSPKFTKLAELI